MQNNLEQEVDKFFCEKSICSDTFSSRIYLHGAGPSAYYLPQIKWNPRLVHQRGYTMLHGQIGLYDPEFEEYRRMKSDGSDFPGAYLPCTRINLNQIGFYQAPPLPKRGDYNQNAESLTELLCSIEKRVRLAAEQFVGDNRYNKKITIPTYGGLVAAEKPFDFTYVGTILWPRDLRLFSAFASEKGIPLTDWHARGFLGEPRNITMH